MFVSPVPRIPEEHGTNEENAVLPAYLENLYEIAAPPPEQNPSEGRLYQHRSIEDTRSRSRERRLSRESRVEETPKDRAFSQNILTLSYLAFFSILGTLARVGLQNLTNYPNAPIVSSEIWANVG